MPHFLHKAVEECRGEGNSVQKQKKVYKNSSLEGKSEPSFENNQNLLSRKVMRGHFKDTESITL